MIEELQAVEGGAARNAERDDPCIHGVAAAAVVEPASADSVASVLKLCAQNGWRVEPCGGGTWLDRRTPPQSPYVLLSTRRLNTIDDYKPEDLTITAGAGVTISALQKVLAENGQWLALDAPQLAGATLGGLAATASAGPLRARYGTPRDHVLGLDITSGDGRPLRFGGQVVKNVAGYDMVRPIVGSRGALGVITRVSLRLRPMHAVDTTLAVRLPLTDAIAAAHEISNAWPVAALEILNDGMWTLLTRFHGHEADVAEAVQRINALLGARTATASRSEAATQTGGTRTTEVSASGVWAELSNAEARAASYIRIGARPSHLDQTMKIANTLSDRIFRVRATIAAHATEGIVRLWENGEDPKTPSHTNAVEINAALLDAAADLEVLDGTISAPSFGFTGRRDDRVVALNRGIMDLFDPAGILPRYRL